MLNLEFTIHFLNGFTLCISKTKLTTLQQGNFYQNGLNFSHFSSKVAKWTFEYFCCENILYDLSSKGLGFFESEAPFPCYLARVVTSHTTQHENNGER